MLVSELSFVGSTAAGHGGMKTPTPTARRTKGNTRPTDGRTDVPTGEKTGTTTVLIRARYLGDHQPVSWLGLDSFWPRSVGLDLEQASKQACNCWPPQEPQQGAAGEISEFRDFHRAVVDTSHCTEKENRHHLAEPVQNPPTWIG